MKTSGQKIQILVGEPGSGKTTYMVNMASIKGSVGRVLHIYCFRTLEAASRIAETRKASFGKNRIMLTASTKMEVFSGGRIDDIVDGGILVTTYAYLKRIDDMSSAQPVIATVLKRIRVPIKIHIDEFTEFVCCTSITWYDGCFINTETGEPIKTITELTDNLQHTVLNKDRTLIEVNMYGRGTYLTWEKAGIPENCKLVKVLRPPSECIVSTHRIAGINKATVYDMSLRSGRKSRYWQRFGTVISKRQTILHEKKVIQTLDDLVQTKNPEEIMQNVRFMPFLYQYTGFDTDLWSMLTKHQVVGYTTGVTKSALMILTRSSVHYVQKKFTSLQNKMFNIKLYHYDGDMIEVIKSHKLTGHCLCFYPTYKSCYEAFSTIKYDKEFNQPCIYVEGSQNVESINCKYHHDIYSAMTTKDKSFYLSSANGILAVGANIDKLVTVIIHKKIKPSFYRCIGVTKSEIEEEINSYIEYKTVQFAGRLFRFSEESEKVIYVHSSMFDTTKSALDCIESIKLTF